MGQTETSREMDVLPQRLQDYIVANPGREADVRALYVGNIPVPVDEDWAYKYVKPDRRMMSALEPTIRDIVSRYPFPLFTPLPAEGITHTAFLTFIVEALHTTFAFELFMDAWRRYRPWETLGPFDDELRDAIMEFSFFEHGEYFHSAVMDFCIICLHGRLPIARAASIRDKMAKLYPEWVGRISASVEPGMSRDLAAIDPIWRREVTDASEMPQVPLPEFLNAGWVSANIAISGAVRSKIAAVSEKIAPACIDPSVVSIRPKHYADMVLGLFCEPFALTVMNALMGSAAPPRERSVFRRFYAEVLAGTDIEAFDAPVVHDQIVLGKLLIAGKHELGLRFAAVRGAECVDEAFVEVLEGFDVPGRDEVVRFLKGRRKLKSWSEMNRREIVAYATAISPEPVGDSHEQVNGTTPLDTKPAIAVTSSEAYRNAMLEVSRLATRLAGETPGFDAVDKIRALVEGLPALVKDYLDSLPKRIDAAPVIDRVGVVRGSILELAEHVGVEVELPDVPAVPDLSETGFELVSASLGRTEGHVTSVREHVARAEELQVTLISAKYVAKPAIMSEITEVTGLAVTGVNEASSGYLEVTGLLMEDLKAVAEPASGGSREATEAENRFISDFLDSLVEEGVEPSLSDAEVQPQAAFASEAVIEVAESPAVTEVAVVESPVVREPAPLPRDVIESDEEVVDLDDTDLAAMSSLVSDVREADDEAEAEDPHPQKIADRVWDFVADGDLGLGYHLATAAEKLHDDEELGITSAELRFAAMGGAMNHTAIMARPEIVGDAVNELWTVPGGLPTAEDEASVARRFMLYPTAIEMAVFHPDSGAENVLRQLNGLGEKVTAVSHALTASVQKVSRMRLQLTPALLGHIGNAIDAESGATQTRRKLMDKLDAFGRATYNFVLGNRVRNHLFLTSSPLGKLRDALGNDDAKALSTAKAYVEEYSTRTQILEMLREGELGAIGRYHGIDGAIRDRMVAVLLEIADLAADYTERREAQSSIVEERPKITQAVAELVSHLTAAQAAFVALAAEEQGNKIGAAAAFVAERFSRLESLLSGNAPSVPTHGLAMALHGNLPLVSGLHFGRTWYPSPYDAGEVVSALLSAPRPLLPESGKDAAFEKTYRRRVLEGSFVGAALMVQMAERYGISANVRTRIADQLTTDRDAAKVDLEATVERTRENLERVIRFGTIDRPEDANRHLSTVERVHAADVPVDIPLEERSDSIGEERIEDVRLARHLLAEVNQEIDALMEAPRQRLIAEIDGLVDTVPECDIKQLRKLVEADDLLTASEFVSLVNEKGAIPTDMSRVRRFDTFAGKVLPELAQSKAHADAAAAALSSRSAYCGLPFDTLSEGRVEEASDILKAWRTLFRNIGSVKSDNTFPSRVSSLHESLGMSSRLLDLHDLTSSQAKRFIGDFEIRLPQDDAEALLLPEFGSLAEGRYRVCMTATLPNEAHLAEWCRTAGKFGVILMVNDFVTPERREQFHQQNLAAQRRVILIDIASILFSISEQEQRALTLFEMAQPYTYAAPYRDWEREQVPVELFVGRRAEISTLYDPNGSCVVYGGRRMGKTAVLRHLVTRYNDPAENILVSYIDAQGIGQGQTLTKRIWSEISRSLPAIFKTPVSEQGKVVEGVHNWLSMDPRRRVLILIDEADDLVKADAAQGYPELLTLQKLMTETRRRLKFVLSGLHNVTRMVQTGNDPVKHISSSPQRIGPLMGAELADAENLVVRPFAALGMEFANRSDVWRILSHANYYPVLVQTYAKHLLELCFEEMRRTQKPMRRIPSALVRKIFERHQAAEEVKDKFLLTLRIDQRYELIAYVVANLVMGSEASGDLEEGVTVSEIREAAMSFWPAGFASRSAVSQFDDLVDEMEGLGILRRTPSGTWTLRSQAVLRLLGTHDEVETVLLDFSGREVPGQFDPKSGRRMLPDLPGDEVASPLTLSQEREILTDTTRVKVIFGTDAGGIEHVPHALLTARWSFSDTDTQDIQQVVPRSRGELVERIGKIKVVSGSQAILIVHVNADWEPDWISAALRARPVVSGSVRVVFVGRPKHLVRVVGNVSAIRSNEVKVYGVEPWSAAFVDERILNRFANMDAETRTAIGAGTGWWGRPMSMILLAANSHKVKSRLERAKSEFSSPDAYGVGPELVRICKLMIESVGPRFSREDLKALLGFDELKDLAGVWKDAGPVLDYGQVLGIFAVAGERKGDAGPIYGLSDPLVDMLQA